MLQISMVVLYVLMFNSGGFLLCWAKFTIGITIFSESPWYKDLKDFNMFPVVAHRSNMSYIFWSTLIWT